VNQAEAPTDAAAIVFRGREPFGALPLIEMFFYRISRGVLSADALYGQAEQATFAEKTIMK
jgi:hypothetical protein